ncbi:aromatic ring-hydroxylating dioxygenase subunit alpha, partial [bacterium]|nr:aromatic ring-hydroxylating dioxygenase subunit alpha [bacterium]
LMKEGDEFRKTDYHLYSAHVGLWGGFVFVNLDEDPVAFEEEMGALINRFQDWNFPELRIAHKIEYSLNCNWKLILQNYQECYHCPGVHPMLSKWTPFRSAVHDCFEGAVIGGFMEISEPRGSMTMDGKAAAPPVCNVSGEDLQRVHYYSVFPNLLLSPHPDFVLYHRIRSLAIDRIQNDCFFLLHPDVISDPKLMERFQSAIEFWDMTNRQDWQVCEQMQLGLQSQRFHRGRYSPQEDILYALDKEVLKALGHEPAE